MCPPDPVSGGPLQNYDVPVYVPTVAALQLLPSGLPHGVSVFVVDGRAAWTLLRINPPAPNGLDIVPFLSCSPATPQPVWVQNQQVPLVAALVAAVSFKITASFPNVGSRLSFRSRRSCSIQPTPRNSSRSSPQPIPRPLRDRPM